MIDNLVKNLKLGFKILRYGHAAKLSIIAGIVLGLLGLVVCAISVLVSYSFPGGYFLMMSVLLLLQLVFTVNAANLVQTSPMKKKLQTSVPALISILLMLAGYFVQVLVSAVMAGLNPETVQLYCTQIIYTAAIMGIIMLYYGAVYKYFVAASAVFIIMFIFAYGPMIRGDILWSWMPFAGFWGNFILTAAIGAAVILVCGGLQYLISLAVYRAPVSKWALGARLRSQL